MHWHAGEKINGNTLKPKRKTINLAFALGFRPCLYIMYTSLILSCHCDIIMFLSV